MGRGPKHHLKRVNAPHHWMLHKLGGIFAPRPNTGGHGLRECLPLILIVRDQLKYALTGPETTKILKSRFVKVDGKARTSPKYPVGFMDVVEIEETGDRFRVLYDTKGRFILRPISEKRAQFKLCKVVQLSTAKQGVPFLRTHDGRIIRYPPPEAKLHDTVKVDIQSGLIQKVVKFDLNNVCMITGGRNTGRIGEIIQRDEHHGSYEIVHIRDMVGHTFCTRRSNVFVVGEGHKSLVQLPKNKGIKLSTIEDRKKKMKKLRAEKKGKKTKRN